jgi:hypothetical protein
MIKKGLWKNGRPLQTTPAETRPSSAPSTSENDVRREKVKQLGAKLLYVSSPVARYELTGAIERI